MEKFQEFQKKFPNLFKEEPRSGFSLNVGWFSLVEKLCSILEHHIARLPEEQRTAITCAQVKEKFGGLRFYMTYSDDYMRGVIALAESLSFEICQTCGQPGQRRSGSWMATLCDHCSDLKEVK